MRFSYYSNLKRFLGKFGPKNWSSPNWLKVGTGVHCYILISNLMFIFLTFLSFIFFKTNLVRKSEVLQINCNFVHGYIVMLITILMFIFPKFLPIKIWPYNLDSFKLIDLMFVFWNFLSVIFSDKFCPKISSFPNWLKFRTGVHCYMFITILMFNFSKFCHSYNFGQI